MSIANDGDLCGLLPEEFKVISVSTSNPQLREIGRLLVSLLLEEGEVETCYRVCAQLQFYLVCVSQD